MAAGKTQKGRKIGRNKDSCKAYRNSGRRERNKARRLLKHFKRYGTASASAVHCFNNLPMTAKPANERSVTLTAPVGKRIAPKDKMPPVRAAIRI